MSTWHDGAADGRGQPSAQDTASSTGQDPLAVQLSDLAGVAVPLTSDGRAIGVLTAQRCSAVTAFAVLRAPSQTSGSALVDRRHVPGQDIPGQDPLTAQPRPAARRSPRAAPRRSTRQRRSLTRRSARRRSAAKKDCRLDGTPPQVDRRPQPSNTLSASRAVHSAADGRGHPLGQRGRVQDQASQALDDLLEFQLSDRNGLRPARI